MATIDIRNLENALSQGRKIDIEIEFSSTDGTPTVDFRIEEDGEFLGSYINAESVEDALFWINAQVGTPDAI